MSNLLRRLVRLEAQLTPTVCECAKRARWLRFANHQGELLPDRSARPADRHCPLHGALPPEERVIQFIKAGEHGGMAPECRPYGSRP